MYNEERENRRLYVASFSDDIPELSSGSLIPKRTLYSAPNGVPVERSVTRWYLRPAFLLVFSVLLFAISIGSTTYSVLRGQSSVAATIGAEGVPFTPEPFNYGVPVTVVSSEDVDEQFEKLMNASSTFIEIDLPEMELRYFEDGTASSSFTIVQRPQSDSRWHVPQGIYAVNEMKEKRYSDFSNIYQPWSILFGENFYLNGIPYYPDGTDVPERYTGGGIRLNDENAEKIFTILETETPVIVRDVARKKDDFVFESKVPGVSATHYLVADIESSTVLAARGLEEPAPIASLTKLMTALVAAEEIDLDKNVPIRSGANSFVASLVPRLQEGYSASMYSLMQLLLLESSNEAAEVIASVSGRGTFIERMNTKAHAIGLSHSTFTDPSGLDDGNESSVGDLFRLAQYIYSNRGFIFELTADQHLPTAYTNGQFGQLVNFNEIDGSNFVAGKVGETDAAGQTSLSLHEIEVHGTHRLVAIIILGSKGRTDDVMKLLNFVDERFNE